MHKELYLVLRWPPSVNACWGTNKFGGFYLKKGAKDYRADVVAMLRELKELDNFLPMEGDRYMEMILHPPDKRKRDLDNVNKAVWDSLQHAGVYKDDYDTSFLTSDRREPIKPGFVLVKIGNRKEQGLDHGYT